MRRVAQARILCFAFFLPLCFCIFSTSFSKVYAAQFSGEYLIKVCSVDKEGRELVQGGQVACQSYIAGVIDYHNMLRSMNLTSNMNFCIPEGTSLNELQIRVLAYMYERAKLHRKFVASPGVAMALFENYPCK